MFRTTSLFLEDCPKINFAQPTHSILYYCYHTAGSGSSYPFDFAYSCVTFDIFKVSLSSPVLDTVFFLGLSFDGNRTDSIERYGLWGYTKNTRHHLKIGYTFPGFVAE